MSVIHVERWHRARHPQVDEAADFCRSISGLERDLRAAGYQIAADLVATAGIAVLQKLEVESAGR
ncbi:MAG TPA: hypothetical protein VK196_15465 [Magnetospirillum sp.]|nr:hypothetical protein [Magnetospirillum sp.]